MFLEIEIGGSGEKDSLCQGRGRPKSFQLEANLVKVDIVLHLNVNDSATNKQMNEQLSNNTTGKPSKRFCWHKHTEQLDVLSSQSRICQINQHNIQTYLFQSRLFSSKTIQLDCDDAHDYHKFMTTMMIMIILMKIVVKLRRVSNTLVHT